MCLLHTLRVTKFQYLDICAPLGLYAVLIGNYLTTFREKILVPFSRVKQSKKNLEYGCSHPGRLVTQATEFFTVTSNTLNLITEIFP